MEGGRNPTGSKAVISDTIRSLAFGHHRSVDIPCGALAVSDPITFPLGAAQVITVSIFLRHGQAGGHITSHPGSRTQTWLSHGDHTNAEDMADSSATSVFHWYFISGVEVWQPRQNCALAMIGDSITDGRCSTDNGNNRWPDLLAERMRDHPFASHIAIINQAAGGNRVLTHLKGPNVLSRLDRDVLAQPGVRYLLVFEGVNDIGTAAPDAAEQAAVGKRLIWAYGQIVSRAHSLGIPVLGATIPPFGAPSTASQPYAVPTMDETRRDVNDWIRTSGIFDAVVDFDALLRDPSNPSHLNPNYNSGDYLHPNVKAFAAMAEAFPLDVFEKIAEGYHGFQ